MNRGRPRKFPRPDEQQKTGDQSEGLIVENETGAEVPMASVLMANVPIGPTTPVPIEEPVFKQQEQPTLQIMSEQDSYLADRMKSQPKTLEEVLMVKESKYAPGEHRLSLPKEFKTYEDRFGFRWINKKKRAVDEAIIKGWVIVNRTLFPQIAKESKHLFSTSGAVEKGDVILAFMKKELAADIRRGPGEKSTAILKAQLEKGKQPLKKGQSGFYIPEDTAEKEDVGVAHGGGLQEGRDF